MKMLLGALAAALTLVSTSSFAQQPADVGLLTPPAGFGASGFGVRSFGGIPGLGYYDGKTWRAVPIAPIQMSALFGDTSVTNWDVFGVPVFRVGARGKQNAIIGFADNGASAPACTTGSESICAFPTGVTGSATLTSAGNQVFGLYGVGQLLTSGTASAVELTAFNNSGQPGDASLPPNTSFGTPTFAAIGSTIGCAANAGATCSLMQRWVQDGGTPGQSENGLYVSPKAVKGVGFYFDFTVSVTFTGTTSGNTFTATTMNGTPVLGEILQGAGFASAHITAIGSNPATCSASTPCTFIFDGPGQTVASTAFTGGFSVNQALVAKVLGSAPTIDLTTVGAYDPNASVLSIKSARSPSGQFAKILQDGSYQNTGWKLDAASKLSSGGNNATYNAASAHDFTFGSETTPSFEIADLGPSGVSYYQAKAGQSGGAPTMSPQGAAANISASFGSKGSAPISFSIPSDGVPLVLSPLGTSAPDAVQIKAGVSGSGATISGTGEVNAPLNIVGGGSAPVNVGSASSPVNVANVTLGIAGVLGKPVTEIASHSNSAYIDPGVGAGFSLTMPDNTDTAVLDGGTDNISGTLSLPPNPTDGQTASVICGITVTLTVQASKPFRGATSVTCNPSTGHQWKYIGQAGKWYSNY